MITVVENFLSKEGADLVEHKILSQSWHLDRKTTHEEGDNNPQFVMPLVMDGKVIQFNALVIAEVFKPKFNSMFGEKKLLRMKANLNVQHAQFEGNHYVIHVDDPILNCSTAIYYVVDSDGDTFFFDDDENVIKQITPKRNTLVYFDRQIKHAGSPPKKSFNRCVLNFVFEGIA